MGQFLYEIAPYQDQVIEQNRVDSFAASCINVLSLSVSRHTDYFLRGELIGSSIINMDSSDEGMECQITESFKEERNIIEFKTVIVSKVRTFEYKVLFDFLPREDGSYAIENILINN